jgi:hypothetical protein
MARFIETVIEFKNYYQTGEIPVDGNTNSLLLTNVGSATAYVNGFPIASGQNWGDSRNAGEIITGKFTITFEPGALASTCNLYVQLTRYK